MRAGGSDREGGRKGVREAGEREERSLTVVNNTDHKATRMTNAILSSTTSAYGGHLNALLPIVGDDYMAALECS